MSRFMALTRPTPAPATVSAVVLLLAACADGTGPVRSGPSAVLTDPGSPVPDSSVHMLREGPTAPPLATLDTAVWVVRGKRQTIRIMYQQPGDVPDSLLEFLKLDFHDSTLAARPDGTPIAPGDSVLVSISIDPNRFTWRLEPSLTFDRPAVFRVRYHFADPDLNRDGVVDDRDEAIRTEHMMLRGLADGLWVGIVADHDLTGRKFEAQLGHFSNYAIAW